MFDRDSGQFKDRREEEEEEYNKPLRALTEAGVRVVELIPDYEAVLRDECGEEQYQQLCQKYPGVSKAVQARLLAADDTTPVPGFVLEILESLGPNN